ncbi:oxygenase MpaB family protein [Nocardia sp. NPDC057227]|uniref:oxygenase MpaB family protein n=1 Tax=Nocardia sp. NPDC057227 TaxID=3346056 RepID=UPI003641FF86
MDVSRLRRTAPDADSLLGRYLGDRRFALALPRAVGLQILHPSVAAAIVAHAPSSLWHHKKRVVSHLVHLAYTPRDPHPAVRYGHELVHGVDSRGRRYHGLTPELFFFQHATYVDTLVTAIETFARPLLDAEKEELYADCRRWYLRYGISARPMPETWAGFTAYLDRVCATELAVTPDSALLTPALLRPDAWWPRTLPDPAVRTLLHPRTRELLGVPLRPGDRVASAAHAIAVRTVLAGLTPRARLIPAARR